MLSIDKDIFNAGSAVRKRLVDYGNVLQALHVVVYTHSRFLNEQVSGNVFAYPTNNRRKFLYIFSAYRKSSRIIKKHNCEIVTSQDAFTGIVALLLIARYKHLKFQAQVHTDFLNKKFRTESIKNKIIYIAYKLTVRKATCVRVVSSRIKESLIDKLHIEGSKIKVLPIFTDTDCLKNSIPTFDLHNRYNQFSHILLILSRLTKEKNIQFGMSEFKKILKTYPKAGLIVVGDGPMKKYLENYAKKLDISGNIVFESKTDDVVSYYKGADVFLVTSNYEGYGLTILEALSCELPVVSFDVGVAKEAGATVVKRKYFANGIYDVLSSKQKGELKMFPYEGKEDYILQFKESLERC